MAVKVHAAHILVKTQQEAGEVLFDLQRGADFGDVARAKSTCPSGKKGGDLGWFGRGQMVKEFEDAAFSTAPGKLSGIVKSQFGYHIIKVIEAK
jgi:peptidyl-prolyl cis-trans isomerase C